MRITQKKSNKYSTILFLISFFIAGFVFTANASPDYTDIYEFTGTESDGNAPVYSTLTLLDDTFYGVTYYGGSNDYGVVFKVNMDGGDFTILHLFTGGLDGRGPDCSLIPQDDILYGTTAYGGSSHDRGTIFTIDTNGNNYAILHAFMISTSDGSHPYTHVILSGTNLYGTTYGGGANDKGVLYKMNTNSTGFTIIHSFGDTGDGSYLMSAPLLLNGVLYGTTYSGGANDKGIIYKVNIDGSNYTILHDFSNGAYSYSDLLLSGNTLYGTTYYGGSNNKGTIFKIDTDGNNFSIIKNFAGGADGRTPVSSLIISDDSLAGMTMHGGAYSNGVIYRVGFDGTGYTNLHEFAGGAGDGAQPEYGTLLEDAGYYYGMTKYGGANDKGVIFKQLIPEPATLSFIIMLIGLFIYRKGN